MPDSTVDGLEQVMVCELLTVILGCVVFWVTACMAVFVQPFDGLVTVKV